MNMMELLLRNIDDEIVWVSGRGCVSHLAAGTSNTQNQRNHIQDTQTQKDNGEEREVMMNPNPRASKSSPPSRKLQPRRRPPSQSDDHHMVKLIIVVFSFWGSGSVGCLNVGVSLSDPLIELFGEVIDEAHRDFKDTDRDMVDILRGEIKRHKVLMKPKSDEGRREMMMMMREHSNHRT
jgi:hypothetical protein